MSAADVCWDRDKITPPGKPRRKQSAPLPPADDAKSASSDIYTHERAGLMERLCVLAGVTAWREPVGGFTNKATRVPHEHVLAAALAFARDHSGKARDVGPDILEALILARMTDHVGNIANKLTNALLDVSARLHQIERTRLRKGAYRVVRGCVLGVTVERMPGITAHDWRFIETFGTRTLWASAEQTLAEVARVLRI